MVCLIFAGMKTVTDLGGPTAVASILGLKPPTVWGWKKIPEWHCPTIELSKEGAVTVEEMRPDVPWRRIPDSKWPHPGGRPVIDLAGKALAKRDARKAAQE